VQSALFLCLWRFAWPPYIYTFRDCYYELWCLFKYVYCFARFSLFFFLAKFQSVYFVFVNTAPVRVVCLFLYSLF